MTATMFFGCAFIAFGPALALYVFTIATEPLRVIFLIIGCVRWGRRGRDVPTRAPDGPPAPSQGLPGW